MLKSNSTTHKLTQTDSSYRQYGALLHKHNRIEMKTVESFDKHINLSLLPFFFRVFHIKAGSTKFYIRNMQCIRDQPSVKKLAKH